jgi:DNA polymerase (family 10)
MALNQELSELFHAMSRILELKGANTFKVIAFQKVGRILGDMTFDLRKMAEEGKLDEIEGVGGSSRKVIEEYIKTGRSTDYEELATSVPAGLLPMLEVPGLGPKTIALFWKSKGITNLEQLIAAIDGGALADLKGIGPKKIESIKQGIAMQASAAGRMGIAEAMPIAQGLLGRLRELPAVKRAEVAGSLRRGRETIGDVDLVCALRAGDVDGEAVTRAFVGFPEVQRVLGQGTTKASVVTAGSGQGGLQVDLRIVPEENFGAAWLYFTGSKDHNVKIRGMSLDRGLTLNEWGLYKLTDYDKAAKKTGEAPAVRPVAANTETEIYAQLGLPYIEPELREGRGEVDAALKGQLPRLITRSDIRGDLHTHTTASDGVASIEEMVEAAMALGYTLLAITDHSKSQTIANGLTAERLLRHVKAIHQVRDRFKGFTLLAGCEVDILADGRLDFEEAVLAELDIVVASPHISLKQDEKKATDRILRAVESRYVNVIGHPTGRLINRRAGLPIDFRPIFAAAAKNGTALEINAGYPRLDLNEQNARAAIDAGVLLAINTDAHSTEALAEIGYGLVVARRAWVTPRHVINCMDATELRKFIARKR